MFLDERSISLGDDIVRSIGVALEASRRLIFIMSPRSVKSQWVELEWASTLYSDPNGATGRIIPLLLEDCEIPFLLRRLKYLDARHLSPEECAELLQQNLGVYGADKQNDIYEGLQLELSRPLRLGSRQYLNRPADHVVDANVRMDRSSYIYGPRMSGKTSLLLRVASEAMLLGKETAYVDLSGPKNLEEILSRIVYTIAPRRVQQFGTTGDVLQIFEQIVQEKHGRVLLIVDEMDSVRRLEESSRLLNIFRMLMDLGFMTMLGAGIMPPWELPEDPMVSPLSASLQPITIGPFSLDGVERLCDLLGARGSLSSGADLLRLTGGHVGLTIAAAESLQAGASLDDLVSSRQDLCYSLSRHIVNSTRHLVSKSALLSLAKGFPVVSARDRERLWLAGATLDPKANPPKIAGEIIRRRFLEIQEEVDDYDV